MEEEVDRRELQLLPPPKPTQIPPPCVAPKASGLTIDTSANPALDLSLSINTVPLQPAPIEETRSSIINVQALKHHSAEQIRLVAVEKAYAERVRELTRRELELAEKEFARARLVWERAREEMEKAEKMKEMATRRIGPTCMEITCQACRQRFRP